MSARAPRAIRVYAANMRGRIGKNGEVMIPKALLRAAGLRAGDAVCFSREGDSIQLERAVSPDGLMGRLAGHGLVGSLAADRPAERRR